MPPGIIGRSYFLWLKSKHISCEEYVSKRITSEIQVIVLSSWPENTHIIRTGKGLINAIYIALNGLKKIFNRIHGFNCKHNTYHVACVLTETYMYYAVL